MVQKIFLRIFICCLLFISANRIVFGDNSTTCISSSPTCQAQNPPITDCTACLNFLTSQGSEKRVEINTLSSQIAVVDSQIELTEARIESTKQQISDLTLNIDTATKKISGLQSSLDNLVKVLLNRMVATYEVGQVQPFGLLLSSTDATNFFSRLNYLKMVQVHDKQLIYLTQQAKNDYANQKNIFEDKKKKVEVLKLQLQTYTNQLDQQKVAKQQAISQNQADLDRINAEITALSNFARSIVGSVQIIPHQDLFDGWGKYYNQRDENWGKNFIGLSNEQVWDVGCLLTSYAMVVTHYGGSINPADVAANSGNFSGASAFFNKPGPSANGHSANDVSYPSLDDLRNDIKAGNAVIAGLSYDGGPIADHWVVLRSVNEDGTFMINDPLYQGAINVPLNDHYNGLKIVEARIYQ